MFLRPREGGPLIDYGRTQRSFPATLSTAPPRELKSERMTSIKGRDTRVNVTLCRVHDRSVLLAFPVEENVENAVPNP